MIITNNGQLIDQNIESDFPLIIKRMEYHQPGPILKKHWHEEFMIFYIEKGSAIIHCNLQPIAVGAGELAVINGNDLHYLENCCSHLIEHYILADLKFLRSYKEDICQYKYINPLLQNHIRFQNKITNDDELISQVLDLFREYEQKKPGYELWVKASLYRIITLLMRRHTAPAVNTLEKKRHHQLLPILKYVNDHFEQKITLNKLAVMANLSPHHLCRLFKSITGMPPIEYVNHLRIDAAVKLLQQYHLPVGEAALAVGFNDSNYFSRLFKKYKNISPTEAQQQIPVPE
jgi:AraC-like DNA-binding protein